MVPPDKGSRVLSGFSNVRSADHDRSRHFKAHPCRRLLCRLPWRLVPVLLLTSPFVLSSSAYEGTGKPQRLIATQQGELAYQAPPGDYETRALCKKCRVEFETDAHEELSTGAITLEIERVDPDGVLWVLLRMHEIPGRLYSVSGTVEVIREDRQSLELPVKYRSYRPGDVFFTVGKRPCSDVNGTLTSLIRFTAAACAPRESTSPSSVYIDDGVLLVLSFDLLGAGDVRIRMTDLKLGTRESGGSVTEPEHVAKSLSYGGILRVRKND